MIIVLLSSLNSVIWLAVIIVCILELLNVDYPYKNSLQREFSKIQVPFNNKYKIFLLFLIPIVISFILNILARILY